MAPIHPVMWTSMGVAALAAVGLLALGHLWIALVAMLIAAGILITAIVQRSTAAEHPSQLEQRRFGRGPYATYQSVVPNADLLARLTDIVEQLRDAAAGENWPIDWAPLNECLAQAAAAAASENFTDAARQYLHAIVALMAQLRQIRGGSA